MAADSANPCSPRQSVAAPAVPPAVRTTSWLRGIIAACLLAVLGNALSLMVVVWQDQVGEVRFVFTLHRTLLLVSQRAEAFAFCTTLLAAVGILNFTPSKPLGMVSATAQVGGFALLGLALLLFAKTGLNLGPYGRGEDDPFRFLRLSLLLAPIVFGGIWLTRRRIEQCRSSV